MEDAAEADGVLEEAVDVEHGGVGAGVGDVVDVRDHLLAHGRCGRRLAAGRRSPRPAPPFLPERMTDRAHLSGDHRMRHGLLVCWRLSVLRFRFSFAILLFSDETVFLRYRNPVVFVAVYLHSLQRIKRYHCASCVSIPLVGLDRCVCRSRRTYLNARQ